MRALVAVWRLARLTPHVLHGLWIVKRRFGAIPAAGRHGYIQWWSVKTLRILGIVLLLIIAVYLWACAFAKRRHMTIKGQKLEKAKQS